MALRERVTTSVGALVYYGDARTIARRISFWLLRLQADSGMTLRGNDVTNRVRINLRQTGKALNILGLARP